MNNFFKLILRLTIKSPDGKDVCMETSRTLAFQPLDGMTILLPLVDETRDDLDAELPVTLGPPVYSYLESSFIECQEDEDVCTYVRDGMPLSDAMKYNVAFYEAYGFKRVRL